MGDISLLLHSVVGPHYAAPENIIKRFLVRYQRGLGVSYRSALARRLRVFDVDVHHLNCDVSIYSSDV